MNNNLTSQRGDPNPSVHLAAEIKQLLKEEAEKMGMGSQDSPVQFSPTMCGLAPFRFADEMVTLVPSEKTVLLRTDCRNELRSAVTATHPPIPQKMTPLLP